MLILDGPHEPHVIRFSPDSSFLAVGRKSTALEMWLLLTPDQPTLNEVAGLVRGLEFHPREPVIYARLGQGELWVLGYDRRTVTPIHQFGFSAHSFALSPDGSSILVGGRVDKRSHFGFKRYSSGGKKRMKRVWSKYSQGVWCRDLVWLAARDAFVSLMDVQLYPEGETHLILQDSSNGQLLARHPRNISSAKGLAEFKEKLVVAAAMMLLVWPTADIASEPLRVPNKTRKHFTSIAFHSSGRYLAATSNDETVKLYDTETWQVAQTFSWNIGRLRSIAFSPDGNLAAAGSDTGKIVVWDVDL
jgi:WD40 repeat protein